MNQTNIINLPVIGMVQHGEQVPTPNGGKRAKELGHFIAKIQDNYMQMFLQKFNEQFKGKQYIEISFCTDDPLTKKYVRYNQGGNACHCIEGQTTASQKTKNGWTPVECNIEQCQYRQKNEQGKTACNRIGWLKFFIPSISQDRIWLMKITGQKSINRLDTYIQVQKMLGNSLKGRYILFLKQEEQTSKATGQTYNNYNLDILKKEDFILSEQIPETTNKTEQLSTENTQNVNNNVVNQEEMVNKKENTATNKTNEESKTTKKKTTTTKEVQKKETKNKTKKVDEKNTNESNLENEKTPLTNEADSKFDEFENYYILESTFTEAIKDKYGNSKDYLVGKFYNMKDQPVNIVIRPEHAAELQECDLGTVVELELKDVWKRNLQ